MFQAIYGIRFNCHSVNKFHIIARRCLAKEKENKEKVFEEILKHCMLPT